MSTEKDIKEEVYKILSRRDHTYQEVKTKLVRKGYLKKDIDCVLSFFEEAGYIDDEKFIKLWIDYRLRTKPMGRYRLINELAKKGIDYSLAKETVNQFYSSEKEAKVLYEIAIELKNKKNIELYDEALHKLGPKLMRRGFNMIEIKNILFKIFDSPSI
mgnify:CR=1 FL=1